MRLALYIVYDNVDCPGDYECQISTTPVRSLKFKLHVVGQFIPHLNSPQLFPSSSLITAILPSSWFLISSKSPLFPEYLSLISVPGPGPGPGIGPGPGPGPGPNPALAPNPVLTLVPVPAAVFTSASATAASTAAASATATPCLCLCHFCCCCLIYGVTPTIMYFNHPSAATLVHQNFKNKDNQKMTVDPMFMIVQNLWLFLTDVTPNNVAPTTDNFRRIFR